MSEFCDHGECGYVLNVLSLHRTYLVGTETLSSQLQVDCLGMWLSSEPSMDISGVSAKVWCYSC